MKDKLTTFVERLKMIGIEIELAGNYPWIYLNKINGIRVTEKFSSNHGFTIAFSPIQEDQRLEFTDIGKIFDLIRKYKSIKRVGPPAKVKITSYTFAIERCLYYPEEDDGFRLWKRVGKYKTETSLLQALKQFRANELTAPKGAKSSDGGKTWRTARFLFKPIHLYYPCHE